MIVPEPRGKQPALHQAQSWTSVLLQDYLDAEALGVIFALCYHGLQLIVNFIIN